MSKPNLPPLPPVPPEIIIDESWDGERIFGQDVAALRAWATAYAEEAVRQALAAQVPVAWIAMVGGDPVDRPSRDRGLVERSAGSWTDGQVSALAIIPETLDG